MHPSSSCHRCGVERAGRRHAEEQLIELREALDDIGLAWLVSTDPKTAGRLLPIAEAHAAGEEQGLVGEFRSRLGITPEATRER